MPALESPTKSESDEMQRAPSAFDFRPTLSTMEVDNTASGQRAQRYARMGAGKRERSAPDARESKLNCIFGTPSCARVLSFD